MKKLLVMLAVVLLAVGCTETEPTAEPSTTTVPPTTTYDYGPDCDLAYTDILDVHVGIMEDLGILAEQADTGNYTALQDTYDSLKDAVPAHLGLVEETKEMCCLLYTSPSPRDS